MLQQMYDLTCWYINVRRLAELFGAGSLPRPTRSADDFLYKPELSSLIKQMVLSRLADTPLPTLEELAITGKVQAGALFTRAGTTYCKGLTEYTMAHQAGKLSELPSVYIKLDGLGGFQRLEFDYHPEHLTSSSAHAHLKGSASLFLLGMITEVKDQTILAKPYVMASVVQNIFDKEHPVLWGVRFEATVDDIDSFSEVKSQKTPTEGDLQILKNISEESIKTAFAAIIGEPDVPKDWGGEKSDLVSNRVFLDGKRVSTAFAFKGPAKFTPMKAVHLGKNGDQITRLFSEHADLLVLQHCHTVTPPVRQTMQAFAKNISHPRRWCVVDGYDTLRLLRAYKPELLTKA